MILSEAFSLSRGLMNDHGLTDWIFEFDGAKNRFGLCRHSRKTISLSRHLTALRPESEIRNTILHEIAHGLVGPGNNHNHIWKRKAIEIGSDGRRCSISNAEVKHNWEAICAAGHIVAKQFRRSSKRISCNKCTGRKVFDERYLVRWVPVS